MDIISKLRTGHENFHNNLTPELRENLTNLAKGQNPEVLFITCSDSRLDPNLFTNTQPGELFIMRNAGNIVPVNKDQESGELGTIQFAVEVLNVKHIIVCGHSDCGAVRGILDLQKIKKFRALTKFLIRSHSKHKLSTENDLATNVCHHTLNQIDRLKKIPFVKERVKAKKLELHAWKLDLETYSLVEYSEKRKKWEPISTEYQPDYLKTINNYIYA